MSRTMSGTMSGISSAALSALILVMAVASCAAETVDECYFTAACYSVAVGSPDIDASRLRPYHAIWTQDLPQDNTWVRSSATFEETLSVGDTGDWRHVQTIRPGDGTAVVGTRRLDKNTLRVLEVDVVFQNMPADQPSRVVYDLSSGQVTADVTFTDGRNSPGPSRDLAIPMFDGQVAGLTLAALPLEKGYVATLPMVIPNLGIYWLEATVVGRKALSAGDGESIDVWEVNANWLNLSDGDVYAPGRNGSGGVYYLAVNPGDGVPPVIEYVNDGGIIAWDGQRREN